MRPERGLIWPRLEQGWGEQYESLKAVFWFGLWLGGFCLTWSVRAAISPCLRSKPQNSLPGFSVLRLSMQLSAGRVGVGRCASDDYASRRSACGHHATGRRPSHDYAAGRSAGGLRAPYNHAFRAGAKRIAGAAKSAQNIGTKMSACRRSAQHPAWRKAGRNGSAYD